MGGRLFAQTQTGYLPSSPPWVLSAHFSSLSSGCPKWNLLCGCILLNQSDSVPSLAILQGLKGSRKPLSALGYLRSFQVEMAEAGLGTIYVLQNRCSPVVSRQATQAGGLSGPWQATVHALHQAPLALGVRSCAHLT